MHNRDMTSAQAERRTARPMGGRPSKMTYSPSGAHKGSARLWDRPLETFGFTIFQVYPNKNRNTTGARIKQNAPGKGALRWSSSVGVYWQVAEPGPTVNGFESAVSE